MGVILDELLAELLSMEPVFHASGHYETIADIESKLSADFYEIGASGRLYTRQIVMSVMSERLQSGYRFSEYQITDEKISSIGNDVYLLTYQLKETNRTTVRSTIWRRSDIGWQIVFHQGTYLYPSIAIEASASTPGAP